VTSNFLKRNKKKSLLALLLLLLRQNRVTALLLFLMLTASMLFLSPSSWITNLPGGTRFAAGVSWVAKSVGVDVSQWGLSVGGQGGYKDLLAAFRTAKYGTGGGVVGWGAFFTRPADQMTKGKDSLGLVLGSRSDLATGQAGSGRMQMTAGEGGEIVGVVSPDDQRFGRNSKSSVVIKKSDLAGKREGWVKEAFAGGFMNGMMGGAAGSGSMAGPGAAGTGALSGGAYAGRGFFEGTVSAGSKAGETARVGLEGAGSVNVPKSKIVGAPKGALSSARAHAIDAKAKSGAMAAANLSGYSKRALIQLAEGDVRARMTMAPGCNPPGCPGEYVATNTGAIYDGNAVNGDSSNILVAPEIDGMDTPDLPDAGMARGYENDANRKLADAQKCQDLDASFGPREMESNKLMQQYSQQFGACMASAGSRCRGWRKFFGRCKKGKEDECRRNYLEPLKSECRNYERMRCDHTHQCPLTASNACVELCNFY
jgi:hypothetical protein